MKIQIINLCKWLHLWIRRIRFCWRLESPQKGISIDERDLSKAISHILESYDMRPLNNPRRERHKNTYFFLLHKFGVLYIFAMFCCVFVPKSAVQISIFGFEHTQSRAFVKSRPNYILNCLSIVPGKRPPSVSNHIFFRSRQANGTF